jgi:hypothetical protein
MSAKAKQTEAMKKRRRCSLNASEETFVPDEREEQQAGDQGDEVENGFAAERVVNVGDRLLNCGNSEEMKV